MAWRVLLTVILLVHAGMAQEGATYEGHPPAWWVARLADEAPDVRQEAAFALGRMGPASEEAVPALAKRLGDADEAVRREAIEALGGIGPAAVPALIEALRNPDSGTRMYAAEQLGRIGPHAAAAAPALAQVAREDKYPYARLEAVRALGRFRPLPLEGREAVLGALSDPDERIAEAAIQRIGAMGDGAKDLVPELIHLAHESWSTPQTSHRTRIEYLLGAITSLGPLARPALPLLLDRHCQHGQQRTSVVYLGPFRPDNCVEAALAAISSEGVLVVGGELLAREQSRKEEAGQALVSGGASGLALLAGALRSRDPETRLAVVRALVATQSQMGLSRVTNERRILPRAVIIPWLVVAARDRDYLVRQEALKGLSGMGAAALPILREALSDRYEQVRQTAMRVLGGLGPVALPVLMEALRNRDPQVVCAAALSISTLKEQAKPAVPALVELLKEPDIPIIHGSLQAIERLGPVAVEALPALQQALRDDDAQVRFWAVQAIGRMGKEASPAAPLLVALMHDDDPGVTKAAADALPNLAPFPAGTTQELLSLLESASPDVLPGVLRSVAAAGAEAEPAVQRLVELTKSSNIQVAATALWSIGRLGPIAASAEPALFDLLRDPHTPFHVEAMEAIARVSPFERSAPILSEALDSKDNRVRLTALSLLLPLGQRASSLSGKVIPLTTSTEADVRFEALLALGSICTGDPEGVAALSRGVGERDKNGGFPVAEMIIRAHKASHRDASLFVAILKSENADARYWGVRGLCEVPTDSTEVVPALLVELRGRNLGWTVQALAKMGEAAKGAVPAMARALATSDAYQRKGILEALAQMGPVAEEALPAIREMCHDLEPEVAKAANEAIQRIEAK